MDDEKIRRINELAKKKKETGHTEAEAAEQKALYEEFLAEFRKNFREGLKNITGKDAESDQ